MGQAVVVVKLLDMCFDVGRIMCREPAKDKESRKKKSKEREEEGELTSDRMKRLRREKLVKVARQRTAWVCLLQRGPYCYYCATSQQSSHTNGSIHTTNNSSYINEEFLIMYFRV